MLKDQLQFFPQRKSLEKTGRVFTVSEITRDIKLILEGAFSEVWVEGEVSNFASVSGHHYFSLKDQSAVLPAVMFSRSNKDVKFKVENGLKLLAFGKISAYGPRGTYQIIVERLEPKGMGGLQLALEQLKEKLEKEGLFKPEHKRPIPYLPSKIALVTSLSGAAIKDILNVLGRRFSDLDVVVAPAQVQGEGAKDSIAEAIRGLNIFNQKAPHRERVEVMIVTRGGGSIEDLWAFNEEIVARAIYDSKIPVISAVGHERDITIADLTADLRAATPSAAAEIVTPKKEDLQEKLKSLSFNLKNSLLDYALDFENRLEDFSYRIYLAAENIFRLNSSELSSTQKKLALLNPAALIEKHLEKITDLKRQILVCIRHFFNLKEAQFKKAAESLNNLSPLNILGRGYSITFKMPENEVIKSTKALLPGDILKTKLDRGEIFSRVTEVSG
ncbi:MAG: exodeoxyribonuclease VII large subunit [Candidatus Omnitrophica bacterium]|nr:exodeoxyribonuclease VII large subunit [Candidatus Omnitrophota bacterium]